jgi:hypothetical protein
LTALHKRKYSSAGDTFASVSVTANSGQDGVLPADSSTRTNEQSQSVDELTMPTLINLQESGLRRSARIRELREKEAQQNKNNKAHVRFGENVKKTTLALFTLISFVSLISMPRHQVNPNMTYTEVFMTRLEEINESFDDTLNHFHFLSFHTEINSNETFTFGEAMKQADKLDFVAAMEKEVQDHESREHWVIVKRSSLPTGAKPIKAIWSFKRKRRPDGSLLKHKARLCAHGGMQTWGDNYWETYSPVVNMLSVRLLLCLSKIFNLDPQSQVKTE